MILMSVNRQRAGLCELAVIVLAVALTGCGRDDDAKVYQVPKDQTQPPAQAPAEPAVAPQSAQPDTNAPSVMPTPNVPALKYQVPKGWVDAKPSEMRVASLSAAGPNGESADISVIPLPVIGHDLDLVNMWRSRVQLPATTDPAAVNAAKPVTIGQDQGRLFEFVSDKPISGKSRQRIVVAMLTRGTMSWFFKITGEDEWVTSQKEKFFQFLKSVTFADDELPQMAEIPAAASGSDNSGSIWTLPANWQPVPPAQFLVAEFTIAGANGAKAEVNVASLTGDGGGVLANVNRWRGQLGLADLAESDLPQTAQKLEVPGGGATQVDFTGTDAKTGAATRLIGVIVSQNGQTWFYKLMGDPQVVAQQQGTFTTFIQSANYANAR